METKRQYLLLAMMTFAIFAAGLLMPYTSVMAREKADRDDYGEYEGERVQLLVDRARLTLDEFLRDPNYAWLQEHIKDARGVLIFPQVVKAGFIFGGSGGTGVFLARDLKAGNWSEPAFYTVGSVTFGLQAGGEAAQVVMLAMTRHAVESLMSSSFKLGGDVSVTLGPVGAGAKAGADIPNVTGDFISFAKSKGLYAGLNLEGAVVGVRDGLNHAYYGKEVRPSDIILRQAVSNRGSDRLRAMLRRVE